jgi:flagellar hook-basal body complex protein FliE
MKLGEIVNSNISTNSLNKLFENNINKGIGLDFEKALKDGVSELNETQTTSYKAMSEIATGKVENLQEAIVKIEKAELNLKLALELKNKTISAYKEVMRMQL